MKMRKMMSNGMRKFIVWMAIYLLICGTVFLSYIFFNTFRSSACTADEFILTFNDNDDLSVKLWSYISFWALSELLPQWKTYAPFNVLKLLPSIFDKYYLLNNFDKLTEQCKVHDNKTYPRYIVNCDFTDNPLKFVDLILKINYKIKENFRFSPIIRDQVLSVIEKQVEKLEKQGKRVYDHAMIVINEENKYNENFTKFYRTVMEKIQDVTEPLFIVIGNLTDIDELKSHERVLIKPKHFNISHELFLASETRYLIIDASIKCTLYSLFSPLQVHIYKPEEPLTGLTKHNKNWHHYK